MNGAEGTGDKAKRRRCQKYVVMKQEGGDWARPGRGRGYRGRGMPVPIPRERHTEIESPCLYRGRIAI